MVEYFHYDKARNADLHVLMPGKLLAFRSPVDIESDQRLFKFIRYASRPHTHTPELDELTPKLRSPPPRASQQTTPLKPESRTAQTPSTRHQAVGSNTGPKSGATLPIADPPLIPRGAPTGGPPGPMTTPFTDGPGYIMYTPGRSVTPGVEPRVAPQ